MTVIFSKSCEYALQAVLFLSVQEKGKFFSAFDISKQLGVPKEFVSKIMQKLSNYGIISSRKGKNGGFYFSRNPEELRLIDIVIAIDGLEIFHNCVLGFPGCGTQTPCPVHNKWGKLRDETYAMLSQETIKDLIDATRSKIEALAELHNE
jgi:Rrf2 family protein